MGRARSISRRKRIIWPVVFALLTGLFVLPAGANEPASGQAPDGPASLASGVTGAPGFTPVSISSAFSGESDSGYAEKSAPDSWIVRWNREAPEEFWEESILIEDKMELGVQVVRPREGVPIGEWALRWRAHPEMFYLEPNQKVELLLSPNDEYFAAQEYLRQIHAPAGWDLVRHATDITVAVIDTGVDLKHPDLADRLVQGANLIQSDKPPQDDHGHGTNVAGIIAAIGNNGIGVSGMAWSVKLMPIKALDSDGLGDEDKLGEAIRHAVDAGADIVVMSLGLNRFSPFLQEIAEYAEQKGVLLISATGNEGKDVKFPAAYPTVLAVGGASVDNRVRLESNHGPEVDLVAPWEVFTTALGSDYGYNQGTSMAAPQVAGAAALVMAAYPELAPHEVRNLLRQTALDIGDKGWDRRAGYGLLQVDQALSAPYRTDMYEPNNSRTSAAVLPLDTQIYGELSDGADPDWFVLQPDYRGTVTVRFQPADPDAANIPKVRMTVYEANRSEPVRVFDDIMGQPPEFAVKKEPVHIVLQFADSRQTGRLPYKLTTQFAIRADDFEDNDRQFKAYNITGDSVELVGTFHKLNDQDWFSFTVTQSASLQLSVEPDSVRMDIGILVQKSGEKAVLVDSQGDGGTETLSGYELSPGRYYIMVNNVITDNAYPVRGEYRLKMQILPKKVDPNEPNNRLYQATRTVADTEYYGQFDQATDQDWFALTIQEESLVEFSLSDIPKDRMILMSLFDSLQTQKQLAVNSMGQERLTMSAVLAKGTYYLKLSANQSFTHQLYRLRYTVSPLVAGFKDIGNHWARKQIEALVKKGAVSGYGDYTFRPSKPMTRAEATTLLVNAFQLRGRTEIRFKDVHANHWAYGAIRTAVNAGMVTGFEDGSFRPDQMVSRAEMAVMLAKAMGLKESSVSRTSYSDIRPEHWAAGWIEQLTAKGVLGGYPDRTFRPEQIATRGEVAVMVINALEK